MEMKTVRYEVGEVVVELTVPEGVVADLDVWVHRSYNDQADTEAMLAAMEPGMDPDVIEARPDALTYRVSAGPGEACDIYVNLGEDEDQDRRPPHPVATALIERRKQEVVEPDGA